MADNNDTGRQSIKRATGNAIARKYTGISIYAPHRLQGGQSIYYCVRFPAKTTSNVGLMLGQRLRRWPNINTALA